METPVSLGMLSTEMLAELEYFFAMVFYGVVAAMCYHLLLFFRALFRHTAYFVDAEDILFLMAAGFAFFLTAYEKNDGILRWYAFAGAGLGCLAYVRTLGASLETARKWLLQKSGKKGRMKAKYSGKGQVLSNEGSSPEHESKTEKKKRS